MGGGGGGGTTQAPVPPGQLETTPEEERLVDFVSFTLDDAQTYWGETLPALGKPYQEAQVVLFRDAADSACGFAQAATGPFYCPGDSRIYLDTTFFDAVLERQLGGPDGGFVEPYVLAHEYGHHIQNLLGTMGQVRSQQGPQSDAVRLELQADCYAGMWARAATTTEDASGLPLVEDISDQDMAEAVAAAKSVGDDRIQQKSGQGVDPEGWTHGSSEQRMAWFSRGYEGGTLEACDTFSASSL